MGAPSSFEPDPPEAQGAGPSSFESDERPQGPPAPEGTHAPNPVNRRSSMLEDVGMMFGLSPDTARSAAKVTETLVGMGNRRLGQTILGSAEPVAAEGHAVTPGEARFLGTAERVTANFGDEMGVYSQQDLQRAQQQQPMQRTIGHGVGEATRTLATLPVGGAGSAAARVAQTAGVVGGTAALDAAGAAQNGQRVGAAVRAGVPAAAAGAALGGGGELAARWVAGRASAAPARAGAARIAQYGGTRQDISRAMAAPGGLERVAQRTAGTGLDTPFGTADTAMEVVANMRDRAVATMDRLTREYGDTGVPLNALREKLETVVNQGLRSPTPEYRQGAETILSHLDDLNAQYGDSIPLSALAQLKSQLYDIAAVGRDSIGTMLPARVQGLRQMARAAHDTFQESLQSLDSQAARAWSEADDLYGTAAEFGRYTQRGQLQEVAPGITRTVRAGVGATVGATIGGSVAGPVGAGIGAVIGGAAGNAVARASNGIRASAYQLAGEVLSRDPAILGEYAQKLAVAVSRGPAMFASWLHALQQQDPGFRQKWQQIQQTGWHPND